MDQPIDLRNHGADEVEKRLWARRRAAKGNAGPIPPMDFSQA
jgi:hypothetical protein